MEFPFVVDGIRGNVPMNFYPMQDDAKKWILHHTPGLSEHCDLPDCAEVRALLSWDDYLYAAARRGSNVVLWRIAADGSYSELGYFASTRTGKLWMVNNDTQLVLVDGPGYVWTRATGAFAEITDPQWADAYTCSYQDGYGLFTDDDTAYWYHSSLNDFSAFASSDFYQKFAKPDGLTSIHSHLREPWIFGPKTTEVFYNAGGDNSSALNPTFARNPGGVIPFGIGSAASSVGDEYGLPMTWLTNYRTVVSAAKYEPQEINNQMLGRNLKAMSSVSDAIGFGYKDAGHTFYVITFPTGDQTWVYDFSMQLWHRLQSYKESGGFGRHRANCYARLGNVHYVGDYTNGKIYKMSTDYYDDNGEEIRRELCTQESVSGYNRRFYPDVMVDLDAGIGVAQSLEPTIILQISSDGHSWGDELERDTGEIGELGQRSIWRRMGSGYRRMYRIVVTDPIPWKVLGVYF